ncbi:MAG: hypothetical protein AAGF48_12905 [Pseudomonadota bacterium]
MANFNALIPTRATAPDIGNALVQGVEFGNKLRNAPMERRLMEARAKQAEAIAANGGISPYQQQMIDIQRAGVGLRAAEANRPDWQRNPSGSGFYNRRNPAQTIGDSGGNNPFYDGKMSGSEGQAAGFADRIAASGRVISDLENITNENKIEAGAQKVFGGLATPFVSADMQKLDQAKRDFINATLRRESGAAISASEFDNAEVQYFPQIGDTPEVLAQKRRNRQTVLEGIAREAGPNYRPDWHKPEPQLPEGWTRNSDGTATDQNGQTYRWQD